MIKKIHNVKINQQIHSFYCIMKIKYFKLKQEIISDKLALVCQEILPRKQCNSSDNFNSINESTLNRTNLIKYLSRNIAEKSV